MKLYLPHNVFNPTGLAACLFVIMTGCTTAPKTTPTAATHPALPPVTRYALSLLGAPYRSGKASRDEGFDCSGFVQHVYERNGISLPRTAQEMARTLPRADFNKLRSGDLVFFNTNGGVYSHVGLYVSGDEFIHAPSKRAGKVLLSSFANPYWRMHFTGARRTLPSVQYSACCRPYRSN